MSHVQEKIQIEINSKPFRGNALSAANTVSKRFGVYFYISPSSQCEAFFIFFLQFLVKPILQKIYRILQTYVLIQA